MEEEAFEAWLTELQARWPLERLNNFERSLDRWRKLWIAAEKAHVCVVVVDARYPLLHLAPGEPPGCLCAWDRSGLLPS